MEAEGVIRGSGSEGAVLEAVAVNATVESLAGYSEREGCSRLVAAGFGQCLLDGVALDDLHTRQR